MSPPHERGHGVGLRMARGWEAVRGAPVSFSWSAAHAGFVICPAPASWILSLC